MNAELYENIESAFRQSARLRKHRNRFTVLSAPDTPMSGRPVGSVTTVHPDPSVAHFATWFTRQPHSRERFRWALRDSLDELMDGQRTGRWCYQHLTKTEKTHLGTAVEINLTREFDLADGADLDWLVDGEDLDCKFSKSFGGWEIPMEMYRCADHGEQSAPEDRAALLLWMDDDNSRWAAGLIRISDRVLRFKEDGTRAYNRDNKRRLSQQGLDRTLWLWGGIQTDLPPNHLLQLDPTRRSRIFDDSTSGQQRVNSLLRELPRTLVTRATIATVAQQDDPMKRARDARLPKNLGGEGFLVLGHQEADPHIAGLLGLPVPVKGEVISCRIAPASDDAAGPRVWLSGDWWQLADDDIEPVAVPPRESYRRSSRSVLACGPGN